MKALRLCMILLCLILCISASAQEEDANVQAGRKYIDMNIHALTKSERKVQHQQTQLLKKLSRKERRYAAKLKRNDSATYAAYSKQSLTYDSIGKLNKEQPTAKRPFGQTSIVDSLRQVQSFLQNNTSAGNSTLDKAGYTEQLNNLQAKSDQDAYISQLIDRRMSSLKRIAATSKAGGFGSLDKTAFYGKSRINAFKKMAEEPSKAEDAALEYLQGRKGFSSYLKNSSGMASIPENASESDLRKMGYQTKQQVTEQLQQKFGSGLPAVQQIMGGQVKDFQDKLSKVKTAANTVKQTKQSAKQLTTIRTPSFKVNPERAKPFWQRIEKQFNWQTSRANVSGSQPAMMQLSGMAGFKHTPKLSYGLGIATSIGLGNGWNDVHLSFEGIGLRSYAAWKWQYGIGAYAGYERMYKRAAFISQKDVTEASEQNPHNRDNYNESVLIGLTKTYRMNDKWNGSLQVLYDIWWKEKSLKSPIVLRFATIKI